MAISTELLHSVLAHLRGPVAEPSSSRQQLLLCCLDPEQGQMTSMGVLCCEAVPRVQGLAAYSSLLGIMTLFAQQRLMVSLPLSVSSYGQEHLSAQCCRSVFLGLMYTAVCMPDLGVSRVSPAIQPESQAIQI